MILVTKIPKASTTAPHVMTTAASNTTVDEEDTTTPFDTSTTEEIATTDIDNNELVNGEPNLLVKCLFQMSPLNHKRATISLAPPIFYVAKMANKR